MVDCEFFYKQFASIISCKISDIYINIIWDEFLYVNIENIFLFRDENEGPLFLDYHYKQARTGCDKKQDEDNVRPVHFDHASKQVSYYSFYYPTVASKDK